MNLTLKLLNIYLPSYVRRSGIKQLFKASAEAFESDMPDIQALSADESLRQFALFTKNQVEKLINMGNDLESVKKRLYEKAFRLGEKYRQKFRVQDLDDVMKTARIFYRIIGIKFKGNAKGEVIINRCYFSDIYNDKICQVMSSMDSGLLAGLANGGELIFNSRITENHPCCQANFILSEKVK
jgi:hypothetical protein